LKSKNHVLYVFKHLYASIEKESNMLLKCFRTNNAVNTYNQLVAAQGFRRPKANKKNRLFLN